MKQNGFALIEVLIALLIIAITLGALFETNTIIIKNIRSFDDKSEALWVAQNIANEIQLGILPLSKTLRPLKGESTMLNSTWYWEATFEATADKSALKTTIDVKPEKNAEAIFTLTTFLTPKGQSNESG